ncbi:MAG: hypothetical protein K5Q68_16345 [Roseococcus sp.]|nr:hypothetical protein [Roseococcus sp.]
MPQADRTRLAARLPADYLGFGYAPLLPDDMRAVAEIGQDVAAAPPLLDADNALIVADVAATRVERTAASSSASAAAGMVTATADRTTGRRLNDVDLWNVVRATSSWNFGPDGLLAETLADSLAWDFDPATGVPQGAAFAGARTNLVANSALGITNAGPLPNLNVSSTDIPTINPALGLRKHTRDTATGDTNIGTHAGNFSLTGGIPYAYSLWVYLPAAQSYGVSPSLTLQPDVAHTLHSAVNADFARRDQWQRISRVFSPTSTGSVPFVLRLVADNGSVVYSCAPQAEAAWFPSNHFVTTGSAAARAQGSIDIPVRVLGNRYNYRQGVLIVEWSSQSGPFASASTSDWFGLVSLGDLGANAAGIVIRPDHTQAQLWRVAGGVGQTSAFVTMSAPTAGQATKVACAWDIDQGLMQIAARGTAGTQLTGQSAFPDVSHVMVGRFGSGRPLFGRISGLEMRPAAAFGATLAAMT